MPRGKTRKGEESKARLLAAAAKEFATRGFHAAKISAIVAEAGLAQGAFYLYFPSKEAVFAELLTRFGLRFRELGDQGRLVTPLQGKEAVVERTRQNLEALFAFLAEDPHLTRMALFQAPEGEALLQAVREQVVRNLQANKEAGHHRPDLPVETAADCMAGAIERIARTRLLTGQAEPAALAAEVTDLLLHGLLA
ncbi:MAG TPA: TetR/AcrR family transcriptional regulator [Symbiobacteriaceae bacterium]|jgi:AcrR family transcriptional regulator|nr:TetR/AcrR family transcriptional regulator [Symbiobacteriaceae bacterium]